MNLQDFEQEWLLLVRPEGYKNPEPTERYNLVVIGAGTAGLVAATGAAALGARVALIEKNQIGGSRFNTGDIPSKTLVRAARAVADIRKAPEFGVSISGEPVFDFAQVMQRVRKLRAGIAATYSIAELTRQGIDVYFGHAAFTDGAHISVEGTQLLFSRALIATGSSPIVPDITGIEAAKASHFQLKLNPAGGGRQGWP